LISGRLQAVTSHRLRIAQAVKQLAADLARTYPFG